MPPLQLDLLPPMVEIPVRLAVAVIREPRDRCWACKARRVLYRIEVSSGVNPDRTSARCAPCWGIRP